MYRRCSFPRLRRWSFGLFIFACFLFCSTVASAVDITLAWDASAGATGYKLFYHEEGRSYNYNSPACDVQNTTCTVSGLDDTKTYYFVVRAYNPYGESGNSNEKHLYPSPTNQAPTASFSASPTSGDAPLSVSFNGSGSSDPDGSIVSYDWAFGNGGGTGMTPSHTYTSAGTYTVTLTVTDDDGATDSASTVIQVTTAPVPNQPPTASFTASPTSGDAPLDVTFDASGSSDPDGSIVSYDWAFGNGGGTGMTPSHTYTSAGTYTVTLTVTDDDGATDSSSRLIQVTDPPASNLPPNQPVIASPYQSEMETDLLLSVETEPYSDPDGDAHQETQWQIVKAADSSVVLEIVSSEHLTKLPVPHAVLDRNTTYNVSVQFVDAHSEPSPSSGPVEFTTHNGIVDFDGDGIPDAYEVDDTVDLNEDGIPDNDQPDVIKSILSAVADNKPVGVSKVSASIDAIETLEPINPATILNKRNKPETFLFGLASYRLRVNKFGATALVRVYYSGDILEANQYYLYNTVDGWHDYTQHTIFNEDGRSVTVELKDGGHGDSDGVANGIIVDPGGVVGAATRGVVGAATTGGAESGGGGGGGCFIATAAFRSRRAEEINILKNFRNNVLLTNAVGKRFVRFYYQASPPIADFIAEHDSLRTVVSWSLLPVVGVSWMALQFGLIPTLALMLATLALVSILTVLFFRRIKMRGY